MYPSCTPSEHTSLVSLDFGFNINNIHMTTLQLSVVLCCCWKRARRARRARKTRELVVKTKEAFKGEAIKQSIL